MKHLNLVLFALIAAAGISWTSSDTFPAGDTPCGVVAMGNYRMDLTKGEMSTQISRDMLIENFKNGLTFVGTSECPGTYQIIDMTLTIDAAREAVYTYDFDFVQQMQSMESFMLTRYFNDAQKLNFNNIKVKNSAGKILDVSSVSFVVKQ
jgi:hypothetical protein